MPTARESLLDAASAAVGDRPWTSVRMVEVAAAAGVSRQTLYNEFRGKDGLAQALVRRETDRAAVRLTVSSVMTPVPTDEDACRRVGQLPRSLPARPPR